MIENEQKRRKARSRERNSPCECCAFPLSQRHHLLPISGWGENEFTIQLCANCHELFHLIYRARFDGSRRSKMMLGKILLSAYHYRNQATIDFLYRKTEEAHELEISFSIAAAEAAERND